MVNSGSPFALHSFWLRPEAAICNTEEKLRNYSTSAITVLCVYKNFYIEEHDLEFLWHFYKKGQPHPGDALGGMMKYEAARKGMRFDGLIKELWALTFPQYGFELDEDKGFLRYRI